MNQNSPNELLANFHKIHTTNLGIERIKKNLRIDTDDAVGWCKEKIRNPDSQIVRKGKNWYITAGMCLITVNASSYTIITAHLLDRK